LKNWLRDGEEMGEEHYFAEKIWRISKLFREAAEEMPLNDFRIRGSLNFVGFLGTARLERTRNNWEKPDEKRQKI
jgi:hypothetical protein